jgi:hypothetical protein
MEFNRIYIFILAILGIILLYSYYYFFKTDNNSIKLWGRIKGNLLKLYYVSMLLSALGFLLLFYYIVTSNIFTQNNINLIFGLLISIIVISMFWMPLSLYYMKNKSEVIKYLIIFILFLVALSTLYLLYVLKSINDKNNKLALIGMTYFFIHAFFFDTITWSYNFF